VNSYILNRGWIDRSSGHVPTYGEITSPFEQKRKERKKKEIKVAEEGADLSSDDGEGSTSKRASKTNDENEGGGGEDDAALLSDTSFDSLASHFEASYNHRFEEPNAAHIPSFPRSFPSLVRRADTTRKEARERRKQRKEEEMAKKREEVRRMKALKQREVKRKLERIKWEGGLSGGGGGEGEEVLRELEVDFEFDGEWDAERHDEQMKGLFAAEEEQGEGVEGWCGEDDGVMLNEDGKPEWEDDIDIGDIPMSEDDAFPVKSKRELKKEKKKQEKREKKKKKKKGEEGDEGGVDVDVMDADVEREEEEEWDGTAEMRKRKLDEYMDEIYGLDFNDLVCLSILSPRFRLIG
jgi:protein KRI1